MPAFWFLVPGVLPDTGFIPPGRLDEISGARKCDPFRFRLRSPYARPVTNAPRPEVSPSPAKPRALLAYTPRPCDTKTRSLMVANNPSGYDHIRLRSSLTYGAHRNVLRLHRHNEPRGRCGPAPGGRGGPPFRDARRHDAWPPQCDVLPIRYGVLRHFYGAQRLHAYCRLLNVTFD